MKAEGDCTLGYFKTFDHEKELPGHLEQMQYDFMIPKMPISNGFDVFYNSQYLFFHKLLSTRFLYSFSISSFTSQISEYFINIIPEAYMITYTCYEVLNI